MHSSHHDDGQFIRHASPTASDDANSDSAMTTLPIGERKLNSDYDPDELYSMTADDMLPNATADGDYSKRLSDFGAQSMLTANHAMACEKLSGRNSFAFWTIVAIMFVLALGNLALTMTIVGVLRVGRGMQHMELVPEAETIKFNGVIDLDRIVKRDGRIEGFGDVPVSITGITIINLLKLAEINILFPGDNAAVQIALLKPNGHAHNRLVLSKNGTTFYGLNQFDVKHAQTGEPIFSAHKPHFNIPAGVDNLHAKAIGATRITAPIDETLAVNSTRGKILFRGTEGVRLASRELRMSADQNVYLRSLNGSIVLDGANGVVIDVQSIPIVGEHGVKLERTHYKLCVCMPQGRLFRIPVVHSGHGAKGLCSHFDVEQDPCA